MKKNILISVFVVFVLLSVFVLIKHIRQSMHIVVIPHFMIDITKVDEFYSLLHDKRYSDKNPDAIVLISPNHFFWQK